MSGQVRAMSATSDTPHWFVLNHIGTSLRDMARKAIDRFNSWQSTDLELFAPTYVVREEKDGAYRMRTVNLTFHYVFVRGTLSQLRLLCAQDNGFSFLLDRTSAFRYAIISDREMMNFKNIARAYHNCLPYFTLDDIDLEEGDLVEVINGAFPGLIGRYMPHHRSTSGDIVLHVYNNVGTIAFNVKATDVRVLEFSNKTTRANDQIDAFTPHLLKALRHYHAEEPLPSPLLAKLSIFCSRMETARLNNRKLNAKLQALLYTASTILGNRPSAHAARERYDHVKASLTNPWTIALISLLFSIADNNPVSSLPPLPSQSPDAAAGLSQGESKAPLSKSQQQIAAEYAYYLASPLPETASAAGNPPKNSLPK